MVDQLSCTLQGHQNNPGNTTISAILKGKKGRCPRSATKAPVVEPANRNFVAEQFSAPVLVAV